MADKKLSEREVVDAFITEAVDIMKKNGQQASQRKVSLDHFGEELVKRVSDKYDIPKETVYKLYKPIHWALFCGSVNLPGKDISPFKLEDGGPSISKTIPIGTFYVALKYNPDEKDIETFSSRIAEEYGSVIAGRFEKNLRGESDKHRDNYQRSGLCSL